MGKKRKIITNVVVSTVTQIIILGLGLVLPRIILTNWGSEYNGLINSITTIMRYIALLEAGINTSTLQALYKSLGRKDDYETSVVIRTSQFYYRKVSFIYALLVIVISVIYPLMLNTTISYWEIVAVIALQGCTGVINFAFRASYQQLLNAEGKYYIISLITLLTTILSYTAKIIAIVVYDNILIMQFLGVIIMLIQVFIYAVYFHKKYRWIEKNVPIEMNLLENRKYYLVQQIAGLVYNSTDTFVLSVFCGLKIASVYTVYNLVYSSLTMIISIIRNSTNFVLGQSYHENKEKFVSIYKTYSGFQILVGNILTSTSMLLILGFIRLYTSGVNDIDYINYLAAILFSANILLDCSRGASLAGANVAGQAPKTTWRYVVEASLNLGVSLILVKIIGMNGVLLGTIVAGLWRTVDSILYFYKNVVNEKPTKEMVFIIINSLLFGVFVYLGYLDIFSVSSYIRFVLYGVLYVCVTSIIYGGLFIAFFRKDAQKLLEIMKLKK